MLHAAERAGKRVTAGNIAFYALKSVKSGRRSTGTSKLDVMAVRTQMQGRARLASLAEPAGAEHDSLEEEFTFHAAGASGVLGHAASM